MEQNAVVRAQDTRTDTVRGLDRIDQRELPLDKKYTYDKTASNVTTHVIDTGIRNSHSEFDERASRDFVDNDSAAAERNGHGTHVARTPEAITVGAVDQARKEIGVELLSQLQLRHVPGHPGAGYGYPFGVVLQ